MDSIGESMKNTQIYLQLSPATLALLGFRAPVIPLVTHTDTDSNSTVSRVTGELKAGCEMGRVVGGQLGGVPIERNAARDRYGSNWTVWWSKLNSNFGAV
jgi:hypothetical protein